MTCDRTLIAGALGLAAIVATLGVKANTVPQANQSLFAPVRFETGATCPNNLKAVETRSGQPVGSLSLVL